MSFHYDKDTGVLLKNGKEVTTTNTNGYRVVRFNGRVVYVHRLAWFLEHGDWPKALDHIDGDRLNNALSNLRLATAAQNAQNMIGKVKGAHYHKHSGRYRSSIMTNGKSKHLGFFSTAEEAAAAYLAAKRQLHTTWRGNAQVI